MNDVSLMVSGTTHQLYAVALRASGRDTAVEDDQRDRGAVSLEQVMWFVAAGVAVAIIATILFGRIRDEANNQPINTITPPAAGTP